MDSKMVAAFVAANVPEPRELSTAAVVAWARASGYEVTEGKRDYRGDLVVEIAQYAPSGPPTAPAPPKRWWRQRPAASSRRECLSRTDFAAGAVIVVRWSPTWVSETRVRYTPYLGYRSSSGRLCEAIAAQFGIDVVDVDLPEQTMVLPLPAWVTVGSCDCGNGWYESTRCFRSEVAGTVEPFAQQLSELLQEVATS